MSSALEPGLDVRAQLVQIDRALAESQKFHAETQKLLAERVKLGAEAGKLNRDRILAPFIAGAATLGAGAGLLAAIQAFLRVHAS